MGTRASITFEDAHNSFTIYQHWDGDPETIARNVERSKMFAWNLPRFEASDFAAAYVAANKEQGGNIRLLKVEAHVCYDTQHDYLVTCDSGFLNIKEIK
jgi:hypothetical protein|tara:strand:+ start:288 stop:584 length:297 start_codon:yes stop_codon:yes gene_type:complete